MLTSALSLGILLLILFLVFGGKRSQSTEDRGELTTSIVQFFLGLVKVIISITLVLGAIYFIGSLLGADIDKAEHAIIEQISGSNEMIGSWQLHKEITLDVRQTIVKKHCESNLSAGKYKTVPQGQYLYSAWKEGGGHLSPRVIDHRGFQLPAIMSEIRRNIRHRFGDSIADYAKRRFGAMIIRTRTPEGASTLWRFTQPEDIFTGTEICIGFNANNDVDFGYKTLSSVGQGDVMSVKLYKWVNPQKK